jgi:uncharacterized protein Yka (UPF0111/DUF47 family)
MEVRTENRNLLDRLFPPKYDFPRMLRDQATATVSAIQSLSVWLSEGKMKDPYDLVRNEKEADHIRYDLEAKLTVAFSTPFDRQDIYSFSKQMDLIVDFAMSTALEMKEFGVPPDAAIKGMTEALLEGVGLISQALNLLPSDYGKVEAMIRDMRSSANSIDKIYVASMAGLFKTKDPFEAMMKREIYHHLRDAGRNLGGSIDALHKIIVGLA